MTWSLLLLLLELSRVSSCSDDNDDTEEEEEICSLLLSRTIFRAISMVSMSWPVEDRSDPRHQEDGSCEAEGDDGNGSVKNDAVEEETGGSVGSTDCRAKINNETTSEGE